MENQINLGALLPINENNGKRAVNARDLYLFLGYDKSQWARWYTTNIINNDFAEEGVDYQTFDTMSNGNATKDFALSIDFAKELSMLARNEKGKQARRYFIACEEKLKEVAVNGFIPSQHHFSQEQYSITQKFEAAEAAARFLNLNNIGKVRMAKAILDPLGIPVPEYLTSTGQKLSARELLVMHGIRIGSAAFNKIMHSKGLLVWNERPSMNSKSKVKRFAALTEEGTKWGENADTIYNNKETQILYYVDKFHDLLVYLQITE